ncbi:helix-turn-helix domain-containing protein [Nocardia wallacei]|uniref:helix-turn-helix domain-containing protein n=1 Tax=Nocardia wallacei TaxID=480035 RepID=UPI0024550DA1|nr:helix-turn-helix transcriptional regulator [Nocardia wallacei]
MAARDQQARRAFGQRLRGLRAATGHTIAKFARALSWHHVKVWRIEQGHQLPTDPEIQQWCRTAGAADVTASVLAAARAIDPRRASRPGRV